MKASRLMSIRIVAAVAMALAAATASVGELEMETSLVNTGFIYYYDLAVDTAGDAHAIMDETSLDRLYYSNNVGGTWGTPEYIDNTSDWGTINVSAAVDSLGFTHIAYDSGPGGGGGNDILTYTTNQSGSWSRDQVRWNSRWYGLDLSPDGLPRVSHYHDYSGLNCAIYDGSSWTHELVDSTGDVGTYAGRYTDLVVDGNDHGHIVYYNYTTDAIRYASNSSGTWEWNEVVTDPDSQHGKITLDPAGNVLVAYVYGSRVWLATPDDGGWNAVPVTDPGSYYYLDVETDDDGVAYVVYNDGDAGALKLAVEADGNFDHYQILDAQAGGSGPVLHLHGNIIHVLAWNRATEELFHLRGSLAIPGDLNGDGCVDQVDLGILLADWGCTGGDCPGDCDGDGNTDQVDLGILLAHWGEGCP